MPLRLRTIVRGSLVVAGAAAPAVALQLPFLASTASASRSKVMTVRRTGSARTVIALLALCVAAIVAAPASAKTLVPRAGYYVGHLSSASAATLPVSFYVSKTGQVSKFSFNWVYSTHEAGVAPDYTPKSCSTGQIMSTQPKPVPVKSGKQPSVKATAGFRFDGDFAVQGWFLTASTVEGAISINGPASTCGDLFFRSAFVASWKNASQPKGK